MPTPLTLVFEATFDGDLISGTAKVGTMAVPFNGKRVRVAGVEVAHSAELVV